MAVVGSFGSLVFEVSRNKIETFDSAKYDISANYSEHKRHLKDPLVEFTGTNNDKFSFSMKFSVFMGVDPVTEINKAIRMERAGEAHYFILGNKPIGKYKWVITSLSAPLEKITQRGIILTASLDVSLLAYPRR